MLLYVKKLGATEKNGVVITNYSENQGIVDFRLHAREVIQKS